MRAWSWFAVVPVALAAAYFAVPPLESRYTGHEATVAAVAPLNLPNITEKPRAKAANLADREIHFAAFGIVPPGLAKVIPKPGRASDVFALESILMAGNQGSAVIDGRLVRQGDIIGSGYRVARIDQHAVWLSDPRVGNGKRKKEALEILRFPEYRDAAQVAQPVRGAPQAPAAGQSRGRSGVEKDYRQILEMLKL